MQEQITKITKKITGILDILICLLLFISCLYKGGFYKEDTLFINMVICMLGLVCLSVKLVLNIRDNKTVTKSKIGTIIDSMVLLLPIAYFLPIMFNTYASKELSIFEVTRYINFAIIYFIVRTSKNKKIYKALFVLMGITLSILGIDEITYRIIGDVLSNLSISYLDSETVKISATLQYANITALVILLSNIIVQKKVILSIQKLKENKRNITAVKTVILMVINIIMQSAILLTTSRMNILLMLLCAVVYAIYLKVKHKKGALDVILLNILSVALVASIDGYLINSNYFMVIFTYILTAILLSVYMCIYMKFGDKIKWSIDKKTKYIVGTLLSLFAVILCFVPTKLNVKTNGEEGNYVTRNVYNVTSGTSTLNIKVNDTKNMSDTAFEINVYEIDEEFNKNIIDHIFTWNFKDNEYTGKIEIGENVNKLQIAITAFTSDVTIEELKIDGKTNTLSYMFIPDSLVFRLKDTISKDSNNSLRFTYYKDAFKLFKKSPIVGHGGEGFKSRYQEVQDTSYISSETHSVFMQILVEAGIIGFAIFVTLIILTLLLILKSKDEEEKMQNLMIFLVFIVTATFDLVFSFGLMINIFAVIVGLSVNTYKEEIKDKDKYELDNKSVLGMCKIMVLSISLMILFLTTIYSVNIYRASMIVVYEDYEEELDLDSSYERVGLYENKIKLDKYNATYISNLIDAYDTHISLLNSVYLNTQDKEMKDTLKNELDIYKIRQKELADSVLDFEYYNKYILEKVARLYFKNYVSFANIYSKNFKSSEIAYVFYIGYAIKLTDRLSLVGPNNLYAQKFAKDIYNDYIETLEKQNKLIDSDMLKQAIEDMKNKLEKLEENI